MNKSIKEYALEEACRTDSIRDLVCPRDVLNPGLYFGILKGYKFRMDIKMLATNLTTTLLLLKNTQFHQSPEYILQKSELLVNEDTMIVDGVLFEKLNPAERNNKRYQNCMYRYFTDVDDYNYLEKGQSPVIDKLIKALDAIWECR